MVLQGLLNEKKKQIVQDFIKIKNKKQNKNKKCI